MSKISKEGFEQIQIIKNALDSMYDKLDVTVYNKTGSKYETTKPFESVESEFEAIAGIIEEASNWEEVS